LSTPPSERADLAECTKLAVRTRVLEVAETRLAFARAHRTHNGRKLEFATRPFLRELMNEPGLANEDIMKCVKCGITEMMVVSQFAAAACGLDVMVALPTHELGDRYAKNRVNRPIARVPTYEQLLGAAPDKADSLAFKAFGQGTINVVTAETKKSFREAPVDWLVVEELDECDPSNIEFAYGRLKDSDYKVITRIANPAFADRGIHALYKQGTQRKWHIRCRECGEAQPLDWFVNVVRTTHDEHGQVTGHELLDREWSPGCGRDVRVFCRHCGAEIDRLEGHPDWAFWRDTNAGAARRSRHFNQLSLPSEPISALWLQFRKALDDEMAMQAFYNDVLGLPYTSAGSKLTPDILDKCIRPYRLPDASPGPCAAGLDVGSRHRLVIYDNPEPEIARLVFAGECRHLGEAMSVIRDYNVERVVADMLPEKEKLHDLQRECGFASDGQWLLWLCLFGGERTLTTWRYASSLDDEVRDELGIEGEDAQNAIRCDRTWLLSCDMRSYVRQKTWLPRAAGDIAGGEFYEELCAIEKVLKVSADGQRRHAWTKGKDHFRLASAYARLACEMLGFDRAAGAPGEDIIVAYAGE